VGEDVDLGDAVEDGDPRDEEGAHEGVLDAEVFAEDGDELVNVKLLMFGDDVLHQAVQKLAPGFDGGVGVGAELAEAFEDEVEVFEEVVARDLGDVVERLARVVPHAAVGVVEADQNGLSQVGKKAIDLLIWLERGPVGWGVGGAERMAGKGEREGGLERQGSRVWTLWRLDLI
jgi:hypothetical protein